MPRGIVFSRGWGLLTDAEILSHVQTLRADPRFDPEFRQVIDFRELQEILATSAIVRNVAELNPFRQDARRAFVVASDEAFGMARMYWSYTESGPDQFRVFRALGPALEWLGLDPMTEWPAETPDAIFGVR